MRLLHFSSLPFDESTHKHLEQRKRAHLVEIQATGENQDDHHGMKHTRTNPGFLLEFKKYRDCRNEFGRKLEIELEKKGFNVGVKSAGFMYRTILGTENCSGKNTAFRSLGFHQ